MGLSHEDLNTTPMAHVRVTIPDDIVNPARSVEMLGLGPKGKLPKAVRWLGVGVATLYYMPLTPRETYLPNELTRVAPETSTAKYLALSFADTYEERTIAFSRIHKDSSAGVWEITF